jgi:hypothetical protein
MKVNGKMGSSMVPASTWQQAARNKKANGRMEKCYHNNQVRKTTWKKISKKTLIRQILRAQIK